MILDRNGDKVPVTEKVLTAALGNQRLGSRILRLFRDRMGAILSTREMKDWCRETELSIRFEDVELYKDIIGGIGRRRY